MLYVSVGLEELAKKVESGKHIAAIEQLALTVLDEARGATTA